jgi:hypothetical protein
MTTFCSWKLNYVIFFALNHVTYSLIEKFVVRECSLFIPGVGTEEKLIEKRKKQPPTLSINHFFPYPTIA